MHIDINLVSQVLNSGRAVFDAADIREAERQRAEPGFRALTSVKFGEVIAMGFTKTAAGGYWSAYARGFWLAPLEARGDTLVFSTLSLPAWLLYACGTRLKPQALELSLRIGEHHFDDHEAFAGALDRDIEQMRAALRDLGVLDTERQAVHLTAATRATLEAGGSLSMRLNAIAARYEAIMRNPEIARGIAEAEKLERELAAQSRASRDEPQRPSEVSGLVCKGGAQ